MPASETIDVQQKGGDPMLFSNLYLFYEKPNAHLGVGKEGEKYPAPLDLPNNIPCRSFHCR